MIVELPFHPAMKEAIVAGKKTVTSRFTAHGVPGDTFFVGEKSYQLTAVMAMRLGDVASSLYVYEGMQSTEEFIKTWNDLYAWSDRKYDPQKIVLVHWFTAAEEASS